jgi:GMP synthase-like glutamine amidotransferase
MTMKKILLVQSRLTPERIERERNNFRRAAGDSAELGFLSSLDEKLAWQTPRAILDGYDGVIFGGSADLDFHGGRPDGDPIRLMSSMVLSRTRNLVSYALAKDIPTLGVCFGHQIIGQIHGGMVSNDREQAKMGAYEVFVTEEGRKDVLFSALPEKFFAQYAHKDSVTNMPEGARLLASSVLCRFAALRYGKRVHTVQFHPEVIQMPRGPEHETAEASRIVKLWIERVVERQVQ